MFQLVTWIENKTNYHKYVYEFNKQNMTDLQMLENSFCKFGPVFTKDLMPLFDTKVPLFEYSSIQNLAHLE